MSDPAVDSKDVVIATLRERIEGLECEVDRMCGDAMSAWRARWKAEAALREALEFAEERSDVKDGHDGVLVPDDWMRLEQMLRRALGLDPA